MAIDEDDSNGVLQAPQVLLSLVLISLTKVETVLLQIPSGDEQKYSVLYTEIEAIEVRFHKKPDAALF